jgi:hypothetical protein
MLFGILGSNGPQKFALIISENTRNYDLRQAALDLGYDGDGVCDIECTVLDGVIVGSTVSTEPSMVVSGFGEGANVTIINHGMIVGAGGAGGDVPWLAARPGKQGGTAINTTYPLLIVNNGVIAGGGGGSGSEAHVGDAGRVACPGGGGAGDVPGPAGIITNAGENYGASSATLTTPGKASNHSGNGPYGGGLGQPGQNYVGAFSDAGIQTSIGGPAGYAIDGISFVTLSGNTLTGPTR